MRRSLISSVLIAVSLLFLPAIRAFAQSGDVVISSNTNWSEGAYQLTSLTVNSAATLTIAGGSTVSVTGAVNVTANAQILVQGKNATGQVGGHWVGTGVTISAGSVHVDSGSKISADGQGYGTGLGPGTTTDTGDYGSGASYGGRGSANSGPTYGSAVTPTDLGSGGRVGFPGSWSAGGGAIRLIVSGTLTDNGSISANGLNHGSYAAGASGGSIYVTTGTIAGTGVFTANGSAGTTGAGGGGRIALYFATNNQFNLASATSGPGGSTASVGTVYLLENGTNLYVTTNLYLPADTTASYAKVTVSNGALLALGGGSHIAVSGALTVTGNSIIALQSKNNTGQINGQWQGTGVTINAGSIQVDHASQINADGQGYGTGLGPGAAASGDYGSGASYGGRGSGNSGPTYGSAVTPTVLGSGGRVGLPGSWSAGGGAIRLIVSGTLTNNGSISANGLNAGSYAAGGSGGSIYVTTGTIAGTGVFTANGSAGTTGAGGGGRIALYYVTDSGFNLTSVTAGAGGAGASPGTTYLLENNANLYVTTNLYFPADSTGSYANVTVSNGALLALGGGSNIAVSGALTVTGNSIIALQSKNNTGQVNGQWQGTGVTINAGSVQIDYGSQINADGQGYGTGLGPGTTADPGNYGSGASHGGRGSGNSGPTYGSALTPTDLGSGGRVGLPGSWSAGGGAIRLIVSGTLTNNGSFSANGAASGNYAAGGSGGSIYVTTGTIAGTGVFMANGGSGTSGSGGGGRIALYYVAKVGFSPTALQVGGGGSTAESGSELFIESTFNNVEVPGGRFVLDQDSSLGFHDITLDSGASLLMGGGATLNAGGTLTVADGASLQLGSKNNSGTVNGQWVGQGATINATDLIVEDGGRINADGQGYGTGLGPGAPATGDYGSGASYGGRGSGNSSPTYGSAATPTDLGSGGRVGLPGSWSAGGGAIRLIVSGTLTNNGSISSDGRASGSYAAGGSGGSIYVTTGTIGGTGVFAATGGAGTTGYGGGGRIAICYGSGGFNTAAITANGGGGKAGAGSITFPCVQVTVGTAPPGLSITVDGTTYNTTQTFIWNLDSTHTLGAPSPQASPGGRYQFASWSDGGGSTHTVTAAKVTTTYMATFILQYQLTTAALPAAGGKVAASPTSADDYYTSGASVQLTATPNTGYAFRSWSGDLTGATNPQTVTMNGPRSVTANFTRSSTTTLSLNPTSVILGSSGPVVMRATVAPAAGTGTPTGSVNFFVNGGTAVGNQALAGGTATFNYNPSALALGTYSITAQYGGDTTFAASASPAQQLTVQGSGPLPSVSTAAATLISGSGATIYGLANANGTSATVWFEWGTSSSLASFTQCSSLAISGTTTTYESCALTGLTSGTIYYYRIAASNSTGTVKGSILNFTAQARDTSGALQFVAMTPCRVADTRNATGPFGGPALTGHSTRHFVLPSSACGIPAVAAAYSLNVTVVPRGGLGYLTVWPSGQAQPLVSTLNSIDGRIKANAAIVPAGTGGAISVFVTDATDVVLDINGYFVPGPIPSGLAFYPLTPCRVADTRLPNAPLGGPYLVGGQSRTLPILSSSCQIPSSAQAYSLNFTAVPRGALGFLSAWPAGRAWPGVSTLNAPTSTVTANAAIVPAGSNGAINVMSATGSNTDVVIDINGYFAPAAAGGLSLYTVTPCRVVDTRTTTGSFKGTQAVDVKNSSCGVLPSAQAFVLNATVVPAGPALGYLTLWPNGQAQPLVSTLNALDGMVTSNLAIVPTANGSINAFSTDATQLVLDVNGYIAP